MAEISQVTINRIVQCYQELVRIINLAKLAEYQLFNEYGEIQATIDDLNALSTVATDATDNFTRLNTITIRIATIQPQADESTVIILEDTITLVETRIAAWLRSVEEIINNWSL